jgi:hypothetical protein
MALSISATILSGASVRPSLSQEATLNLHEYVLRLLANLDLLEVTVRHFDEKPGSFGSVCKATREINRYLDLLFEAWDSIVQISVEKSIPQNFRALGNLVLKTAIEIGSNSRSLKAGRYDFRPEFSKHSAAFKSSVLKISTPAAASLSTLEQLFEGFPPTEIVPLGTLRQAFSIVSEVCRAATGALRNGPLPQPQIAARLPYRFPVPNLSDLPSLSVEEIHSLVISSAASCQESVDALIAALSEIQTLGSSITQRLTEFHRAVSDLVINISQMRGSTWNPHSQNELTIVRDNLINVGDTSIDITRLRLICADDWRDSVSRFVPLARAAFESALSSAQAVVITTRSDLAVTNEAERKIVAAARAIASFQQRLERLRPVALEKRTVIGDGYIGGDMIDIGGPILNTIAALVESAQQQSKFVLMKDRTGVGQGVLVKATESVVAVLDAFVGAIGQTVAHEQGASGKVLESREKLGAAVGSFQSDEIRKNGNPELNQVMSRITGSVQTMLNQLGTFVEAAENARKEQATGRSSAPVRRVSQNVTMLELLDAEAKVVSCRRELQFAEDLLKALTSTK